MSRTRFALRPQSPPASLLADVLALTLIDLQKRSRNLEERKDMSASATEKYYCETVVRLSAI